MDDEGKDKWHSSVREDDNDVDRGKRKRKRSDEDEAKDKDGTSEIPSNRTIEEGGDHRRADYLPSCRCQATKARTQSVPSKKQLIETWLSESCRSPHGPDIEPSPPSSQDDMAPKSTEAVSLRSDTLSRLGTGYSRSIATAASVHDFNYEKSLAMRNIYIERIDPPVELMRRAMGIIARPRASPVVDDAVAEELVRIARGLRNENEDTIMSDLGVGIIPAITRVPDERLAKSANQLWSNHVPVPLNPDILINPLRLPNPKPDRAFGYSSSAFTSNQRSIIDSLVDDKFGKSYAMPDDKLLFPFLNIEFKSQAKGGTHYLASNQVANAGAIALYGHLELMQRSSHVQKLDMNNPQFFSASIDHEQVRINVHWLRGGLGGDLTYSFHVDVVAKYSLDNKEGAKAAMEAIKNILDYSLDTRLKGISEALDEYRQIFVAARDAEVFE
ncbi:hypothetical protein VF21_06930 [Pseudogymnoascus sp. 05NY08]|nr:hypothetical protein VF21_06930 [Pseudogymnoascus sp. 05NY08]